MRQEVKIYENTNGIEIKYDILNKEILNTNDKFKTAFFKRYDIKDIIYDEYMICCFFRYEEHPFKKMFDENFIEFTKLFTHYGLSVILDNTNYGIATILVFPKEKVKIFKQ